jgi:hypothetical protein
MKTGIKGDRRIIGGEGDMLGHNRLIQNNHKRSNKKRQERRKEKGVRRECRRVRKRGRKNRDIKTNTRNEVRCRDGVTIKINYM